MNEFHVVGLALVVLAVLMAGWQPLLWWLEDAPDAGREDEL